jgi:EamA domain-containing membrane protein RarD
MKEKTKKNIGLSLALVLVIILTKQSQELPWWSFVIPVTGIGVVVRLKKWNISSFPIGFLIGFFIWFGSSLYFHFTFNGNILNKDGNIPMLLLLIGSGLIGGILTGLSLNLGYSIFKAPLQ